MNEVFIANTSNLRGHRRHRRFKLRRRFVLTGLVLLHVSLAYGVTLAADVTPFETILFTGDVIPGESHPFTEAGAPALNNSGEIAFRAIQDPADGPSLWSTVGGLHVVARRGASIIGASGEKFSDVRSIVLADNGDVVFNAATRDGLSSAGYGVFLERGGITSVLAYKGLPAAGFPIGAAFEDLSSAFPAVSRSGEIAFSGSVYAIGIENDTTRGRWRFNDGQLELMLRGGTPAPGVSGPASFERLATGEVSADGSVTALGTLQGIGISSRNRFGFWSDRTGSLELIVRQGDPIPGQSGRVFEDVGSPYRIDGNSRLTFEAHRSGPGIDGSNNTCLFSDATGMIESLVCKGDVLPGVGPDTKVAEIMFSTVFARPSSFALNSKGIYAFGAELIGSTINSRNSFALWTGTAGNWDLVARSGDAVPGGRVQDVFVEFTNPNVNERGQVAFSAKVRRAFSSEPTRTGLWAQDSNGELQLIALVGEEFEVRPGDIRTISSIAYFHGTQSNGEPAAFNDRGQLAFSLYFVDGTNGVFVSNVVAIPEPTTLSLTIVAVCAVFSLNRLRNFVTAR